MGTLQFDFDELQVELFGNLPIVGMVDLGILREGAQFDLDFDCAVSGDEWLLGGPAREVSLSSGSSPHSFCCVIC